MVEVMNRRNFFNLVGAGTVGLSIPEWLLDPPKGRSMVQVVETMGDLEESVPRFQPKSFALGFPVSKAIIKDDAWAYLPWADLPLWIGQLPSLPK